MSAPSERLILASKSAARRSMLADAGVAFSVQVADVDEDAVKAVHDPADAAGLAVLDEEYIEIAVGRELAPAAGSDGVDAGVIADELEQRRHRRLDI